MPAKQKSILERMINVDSPFFNDPLRRIVAVCLIGIWTLFEMLNGSTVIAFLLLATTIWCIYKFFVAYEGPFVDEDDD
ncbi:MAG: hypothetical protein GKR98_17755 [Boseongicola sp.]|nr:MAG: hypothetical protein GKR98_17755 [Boseongicola sp.]